MNVDALIRNFRSALVAVIPAAEAVGIPWRREDAYDEWDGIATQLYESLVESRLCWALTESDREQFHLPPYDLLLTKYETTAVIEVTVPSVTSRRVFHALGSSKEPFDICECRLVRPDGTVASEIVESYPLTDVRFRVRFYRSDSSVIMLDEL
jgi:hypothetical protein